MASKDKKTVRSTSGGSRPAGGFRTLADLNRRSTPDSDSDSDNAPQEDYTGGEKSGMLVQDPSRGNHVDEIFNQARQLGAVEEPFDNSQPSSSRSFHGTARTLASVQAVAAASQQPEAVVHNITFWQNGFTVNDGPLRRLDDPDNASFLESIKKSECPKELEPADRRSSVHVNLTRKHNLYTEPEKPKVPFQGVGRTLGSSSSSGVSEESAPAPLTIARARAPSAGLVVDQNQPSTPIQLRLTDGTRLVAHFNYHHTISDIRNFIDASQPGGSRTYHLQTVGFPPKPLNDLNQTIEQAGLANSVIIQKL
ncbi:plant UBX domain-containing protein 4-like isoform X1 [Amaranthus tricolor]|uniref:plant UBX domain-containing protein 4-like isoform X1 n=2 Tax=Amaranthus tricolor TaxID=29722 RepID=UPI0025889464|nr:plant UBX domain-containing protein 4-like isoform X1 [Amaranthus tricolor]